jgi:type IV pilus assembly protein PilY1
MRRQHQKIRERSARIALACASVTALAASPASAQQLDANPPLPDVMLVVDTSGSMELMMDGCNTDTGLYADGSGGGCCNGTIPCVSSSCAPGCGTQTTFCDGVHAQPQNRWAAQVAALTGTYLNSGENGAAYSCFSMPRTAGSAFANEFSYQYSSGSTASPYDLNYYLNYHRPVEPIVPSGGGTPTTACAFGFVQGASGWNAANTGTGVTHSENPLSPTQPDFAAAAIQGYVYNIATMTPVVPQTPCIMGQAENGLINFGINAIRFGLMTIDSDTLPNSGVSVTSDNGDLTFTDVANGGSTNNLTTGMWSYYNGWETPGSPPTFPGATVGRPAGCNETGITNIPYEVGARNPAAPPWEGRLMRFPGPGVASPAANNTNIMQAIRVMRPYGANPIAGLMDDAKYFFWTDPQGPSNPTVDPLGSCRPQYIILLSHAAPNEDLEPYCQGTANGSAGMCPYDYPQYIAAGLANGSYSPSNGIPNNQSASAAGTPVKTFVVGFSLQSQIGDAGEYTSCKQILQGPVGSQTVNPQYCGTPSTTGTDSGTAPTIANASAYASCCALAQIAVSGGTQAPYFADNSADLNTALAAIEAIIVNGMTTRAIPVLLPSATSASGTGGSSSALFVSSFSPSYVTSWSGNVQRERYTCPEPAAPANPYQPIATSSGDDFAYNLNNSGGQTRNVIMVEPSLNGATRVSATSTIRPWVNGTTSPTAFDGYTMNDGTDYGYSYTTAANTAVSLNGSTYGNAPAISGPGITSDVLFPGGCSYTPPPGMTFQKPADCELMALGWLLGMQSPITDWNPTIAPYPNRYYTGPGSNPPSPSPFGGVYHSTPVVATPPSALLRDDSYQAFSQFYTTAYAENSQGAAEARHTVLYVATTDGLLHAFGVDYNLNDTYTFTGTNHANEGGTIGTQNEMWSFVPPAVLPLLMSTVGGGQSVVLDGAPVVKDTVFQRTSTGYGSDWHTSLVAGFGSAMGGYYALDVTDPSFADRGGNSSFGPLHNSANSGTPPTYSAGTGYMGPRNSGSTNTQAPPGGAMPMGPHFLWQLMDSNLFAPTSGTPAITTVSINDPDTTGTPLTEVGVAILPGGAATPYPSSCQRVTCPSGGVSAGGSCTAGAAKVSDASPSGYPLGPWVRQWTATGCPSTNLSPTGATVNPGQGRSLTVVRLDTGEVLRTFTVLTDIPSTFALYGTGGSFATNPMGYAYKGRVTQADFDSPISGTPVPYPSDVGAIAQRVFVGDEDGTIWRLDVSDPNPNNWFVEPFIDAYNTTVQTAAGASSSASFALQRAPIVLAPAVSVGRDGNVVVNFGTGDTNFIGTATNDNFVYSIGELPSTTTAAATCAIASSRCLLANLNWYLSLPTAGEMMTGPSVVFNGSYYFATFRPLTGSQACSPGSAYIWGMDYTLPADTNGTEQTVPATVLSNGGVYAMSGGTSGNVQSVLSGTAIIPGVTITSTLACATSNVLGDPATGGVMVSMSGGSPPTYQISALEAQPGGTTNASGAAVSQVSIAVSVHSSTLVDSWASIVE